MITYLPFHVTFSFHVHQLILYLVLRRTPVCSSIYRARFYSVHRTSVYPVFTTVGHSNLITKMKNFLETFYTKGPRRGSSW